MNVTYATILSFAFMAFLLSGLSFPTSLQDVLNIHVGSVHVLGINVNHKIL